MQNAYHTDSDRPTFQKDTYKYRNSGDKYHRADKGMMYKDQPLQPNSLHICDEYRKTNTKLNENKTKSHKLLATQPIVAYDRAENKHPPSVTKKYHRPPVFFLQSAKKRCCKIKFIIKIMSSCL